jgi:hypothetical protein
MHAIAGSRDDAEIVSDEQRRSVKLLAQRIDEFEWACDAS